MKFKIYLISLTLIALISSMQLKAETLSISTTTNVLNSADANYKELYGNNNLFYGFQINLGILKNMYIWGSYSKGSFNGETFYLKTSIKCSRSFLDFGIGASIKILKPLSLFLETGMSYADFNEDSFGAVNKESKFGYVINGGLKLRIFKPVFIRINCGYISADILINDADIKLGGIIFSGGIGLSF